MLPLFESKEVGRVMGNMLEPPAIEAVANAVSRLQEVAALDSTQDLTPLGWHLAGKLPHICWKLAYNLCSGFSWVNPVTRVYFETG